MGATAHPGMQAEAVRLGAQARGSFPVPAGHGAQAQRLLSGARSQRARNHNWYMSARMICVNDLHTFDPGVVVTPDQFEDIVGRHFKTPKEGLGNDNTPSSHIWRTLHRPTNALQLCRH